MCDAGASPYFTDCNPSQLCPRAELLAPLHQTRTYVVSLVIRNRGGRSPSREISVNVIKQIEAPASPTVYLARFDKPRKQQDSVRKIARLTET